MDKDIVVKNERLKKVLAWFEKKSLPARAFVLTLAGFLTLGVVFGVFTLIYFVLGLWGLFATIFFSLIYVLILAAML